MEQPLQSTSVETKHSIFTITSADLLQAQGLSGTFTQEEMLRQLLDMKQALDQSALLSVADAQGIIRYANERFCSTMGYTEEELLGQPYRIMNAGVHPKSFFIDLWHTIQQGQIWQGEVCNKTKQGALCWLMTTIVPFLDAQGKPFQYITIRTDITSHKKAEADLQQLNEELEERVAERTRQLEASNQELMATIARQTRQHSQFKEHLIQLQALVFDTDPNRPDSSDSSPQPNTGLNTLLDDLTTREQEVVQLLVAGQTNKEIAESLTISIHTAKAHISSIIHKLDVTDRSQAVIKLLRLGYQP